MTTSSTPTGPSVGLAVEPRLLHDALESALRREGVTIVDLRDGATCDILLTSEAATEGSGATVVQVDEAGSTAAGLLSVAQVLALIDQWRPHAPT